MPVGLQLRALGKEGLRFLRQEMTEKEILLPAPAASYPSVWRKSELLAVPHAGFWTPALPDQQLKLEFIGAFSSAGIRNPAA